MNKKIASEIAIGIILLIAILTGGIFWMQNKGNVNIEQDKRKELVKPNEKKGVACTMEAKLCDDGSYVSRTGPNCEFAACPIIAENANWQVYKNDKYGYEIRYPENWNYKLENNSVCFRENGKKYTVELSDVCAISISESTSANTERLGVELWLKQKSKLGAKISNVEVGSNKAFRVDDLLGTETVVTSMGKNGLEIDIAAPNLGNDEMNKQIGYIYNEMLSNFRFSN